MSRFIEIKGAREHNLKNVNLKLPRDSFIVVSGLSGSGKSSLAFDTIYAEGQRRYVESLSPYARQFLGQMKKPRVDSISGIPPAVAIQQKGPGYNPRSTVGTLTEIYDYLRLLFARVGIPHCPECSRKIKSQSTSEIVRQIIDEAQGKNVKILAPVVRGRKGSYRELFERLRSEGFVSVEVDMAVYSLDEDIELDGRKKHVINIVVDEIEVTGSESNSERIFDSIEIALKKSKGIVHVRGMPGGVEIFSVHYSCPVCGISIGEIEPRNFSFNSPYGACMSCSGLGVKLVVDPELVVPDKDLSINDGAIKVWWDPITNRRKRWKGSARQYKYSMIKELSNALGFSMDAPFGKLPRSIRDILLYGSEDEFDFKVELHGRIYRKRDRFEGAVSELERRHIQTDSDYIRETIQRDYMRELSCPECKGRRLKKESLAVLMGGKNISDLTALPVVQLIAHFKSLKLSDHEKLIASKILQELHSRLGFLVDVGIDYVTLDRKASSLSSGESERIRLATQIGSSLVGVAYILDEPTVGLHARDTKRLIDSLKNLQKIGNTLIVVEHDQQTLEASDYVVDLGPAAGVNGGEVVFSGSLEKFKKSAKTLTAGYFSGRMQVPVPQKRRQPGAEKIILTGCRQYNLKNLKAEFPLGVFTCVTGVSGSGKSTLVEEILCKALKKKLNPHSLEVPGRFKNISGDENVKRVINIDQSPIGRTPRSNPATYTGAFTPIRELFAQLPLSRSRGYGKGRFSFNVKDGTCQKCSGQGLIKLEMHFLPDIYVACESCGGKKYTDATLDVQFRGKNIHEILELTIDESLELFS